VAENPALTLARVLGGVVLLQGGLGHQVLGQLLIAGSDDLAIAGAYLAVSATTRQENALAQAAIRTVVPAIAVHSLIKQDLARLEAKEKRLIRESRHARSRFEDLREQHQDVLAERDDLRTHLSVLRAARALPGPPPATPAGPQPRTSAPSSTPTPKPPPARVKPRRSTKRAKPRQSEAARKRRRSRSKS